jgi:hypothetical protein
MHNTSLLKDVRFAPPKSIQAVKSIFNLVFNKPLKLLTARQQPKSKEQRTNTTPSTP